MSQQKELDYSLEKDAYDVCILGTGIVESLLASSLSKKFGKSVLVVDIDTSYSSSLKTLNLKEFHQQVSEFGQSKES